MPSFFMPSSFFMASLDMVSFFMPSFDMVSFFMPSSLPILSWAKATGASARLSDRVAAELPSAIRELMVIGGDPFELLKATDAARFRDGPSDRFVTPGLKIFRRRAFEARGGVQEDISPTSFR